MKCFPVHILEVSSNIYPNNRGKDLFPGLSHPNCGFVCRSRESAPPNTHRIRFRNPNPGGNITPSASPPVAPARKIVCVHSHRLSAPSRTAISVARANKPPYEEACRRLMADHSVVTAPNVKPKKHRRIYQGKFKRVGFALAREASSQGGNTSSAPRSCVPGKRCVNYVRARLFQSYQSWRWIGLDAPHATSESGGPHVAAGRLLRPC